MIIHHILSTLFIVDLTVLVLAWLGVLSTKNDDSRFEAICLTVFGVTIIFEVLIGASITINFIWS